MVDWYCIIGGAQHGPIGEADLLAWARAGSLRPTDLVWTAAMENWADAGSVDALKNAFAAAPPPAGRPPSFKAHRGQAVLTLGILGIVPCFICGIIAWVMGNRDMREMNLGVMDPAGKGMTQAGRICGIVGTCIGCTYFAFWLVYLVIIIALFGGMAASGKL